MIFRSHSNYVRPEPSQALYFTPTHEPPLDSFRPRAELWWTGMNIYYLQADNLWVSALCRVAGRWTDSRLVTNWLDAALIAPVLVNVGGIIETTIAEMGLEPERLSNGWSFSNITQADMDELTRLAERWHLGYCASTFPIKRYFRKPLIQHGFTWTYGKK